MSIIFEIKKILGLADFHPDFGTYYIKQPGEAEDALACVAMVLNYYDQYTPISSFRKKYRHFRNTATVSELTKLCNLSGLSTEHFEGDFLELKNVDMPCIIRWRMNRYAVLLKVNHETYSIFDPVCERYEYQQYEVECYYCESALICKKQ